MRHCVAWPALARVLNTLCLILLCVPMRVCVSVLLCGREISHRRVREFLHMSAAHVCMEVQQGRDEFSLLWDSNYGEYGYGGSGKRFALNLGKAVKVWGERYEPCDVRDFVLQGDERKLGSVLTAYERIRESRAIAWECEGELRKLSGWASASAVWELMGVAGVGGVASVGRDRDSTVVTVSELHDILVRRSRLVGNSGVGARDLEWTRDSSKHQV